ncbi:transcriptional regulator [Croceibacterium mercuriale]|uniref:Transcriptional regulator n=1 Tax=Croceibacterium mercuriale TaxID=1572751 RepID=A0A0B2BX82_9SPHN|nr:helix-turn-helix domain-containing protein [Croceibacterium mercuriale]KHL26203.1 transcriptional regulator [Croceibacterium mercuriale]
MKSSEVTGPGLRNPVHGKWYADACGMAFAMELVGERWALLIVRELMLGPLRFSDLRARLPGLSAKVLTERLAGMEATGILIRRKLPPPTPAQLFQLTDWGLALEPSIQELGRWAAMSPAHDPQLPMSPVSFMLSLRTMLDRQAARTLDVQAGFTVARDSFLAELGAGAMPVRRAEPGEGTIGFAADTALPLLRVFYGKQPLHQAEQAGVAIRGDRDLARRFVALFALPPKLA